MKILLRGKNLSLNSAHDGYTYQDLLISYYILKDILDGNRESIYSIDKKHTTGKYTSIEKDKDGNFKEKSVPDRFDDFVIKKMSDIERKQIKYSNEENDRKLIKNDFANDSKGLALYELFRSWTELKDSTKEFRVCLAWNNPEDEDIVSILKKVDETSSFIEFQTTIYKIDIDKLWKKNSLPSRNWSNFRKFIEDYKIERKYFINFFENLIIELEFPKASLDFENPNNLEVILINQAKRLGIGIYPNDNRTITDFLNTLAYTVSKLKSNEINIQTLLQKLEVITDFGSIEQKFEIDESKNIKNDVDFSSFYNLILKNQKTLLLGEPGSGKSWFLTNFINYLIENGNQVVRHYCYTSVEDEFAEKRIESDVFFGNLIKDLLDKIPSLQKIKTNFISDLGELNFLLFNVKEPLVILIDGLDHIDRLLKNSKQLFIEKTRIIDFISKINLPKNVSIVLGSQPIVELKKLKDKFSFKEYNISKWTKEETLSLMSKYSLKDKTVDDMMLSEHILNKSEGNSLYITYILKEISNKEITLELINTLPSYDFNLSKYYDYLTNQIDDNNTSEVFSCLEFSVNKIELKELVHYSGHVENNLKVLSSVISENSSIGGFRLYHDSFRRYNIENLEKSGHINEIYLDIAIWLEKKGFYKFTKSYYHLFKYYIKAEKYKEIKKYAKNNFLSKSLFNGYSKNLIKNNYDKISYVASKTEDWSLFIFISELNRTLNSSLSEYHDEFLQHFEEYFNLIISIYGLQKAYEMLFFEGKKVFDDETTAKAFYTLYNQGMVIDWRKIESYLKNNQTTDKYKYYICLLITTNQINTWLEEKKDILIQEKYFDFLRIVIEELYYSFGINKVLYFLDLFKEGHVNSLLISINSILENIGSSELLLVKNELKGSLLELNDEIFYEEKYINKNKLNDFLYLIEDYANYDIEKLKEFNTSLSIYDFSLAWLRFTINIFIFEYELSEGIIKTYQEFEEKLIDNFAMLKCYTNCENLHHEHQYIIQRPIFRMFEYIENRWEEVILIINFLKESSNRLNLYFYIGMLKDYECNENREYLINEYETILIEDEQKSDGYSFLIDTTFSLALLYSNNRQKKKARKCFKKGISYITAYTFRKDTTLNELINPLDSIKYINEKAAIEYSQELLALNLTIEANSEDGKGMKWLYIKWFDKLFLVNREMAISFLVNKLLEDEYNWKYEHMFTNLITSISDVDPVALNFLHKISDKEFYEDYIESFSDTIFLIKEIDKKLAKQSLIFLLNLETNIENLKIKNKLSILQSELEVTKEIKFKKEEKSKYSILDDSLYTKINNRFNVNNLSSSNSKKEICNYFEKKDLLTNKELNFLKFYLEEKKNDRLTLDILFPIIRKRFVGREKYYENLRYLVLSLTCRNKTKIELLVNTFVYSQGGWLENFVNKEAFYDAVNFNKKQALTYLAKELHQKFNKIYYNSQSTANLIIAFKDAGIKDKYIMQMYKQGFSFIKSRILNIKEIDNKIFDNNSIHHMSIDEKMIVLLLVKLKNYSKSNQEEILYAINYLMIYRSELLQEPFKWFFSNLKYFPHLSIAAVLEILIINKNECFNLLTKLTSFILNIKDIENMCLHSTLNSFLMELENV
jgi:hypothetical protein